MRVKNLLHPSETSFRRDPRRSVQVTDQPEALSEDNKATRALPLSQLRSDILRATENASRQIRGARQTHGQTLPPLIERGRKLYDRQGETVVFSEVP